MSAVASIGEHVSLVAPLALLLASAVGLATAGPTTPGPKPGQDRDPTVQRVTPILVVDEIEPVLPLWERLGFERTDQVEVEGRLVFVILGKDDTEVMYQTLASIESDVPAAAAALRGSHGLLFIEVDDLDAVVERLGDAVVVVPRRTTDYGATEVFVQDAAGNVIGFAEFGS